MSCKHQHNSLVYAQTKSDGPFLTWQCDTCGQALPFKPIDAATFDKWMWGALEVPEMDYEAYKQAAVRAVDETFAREATSVERLAKILRR
jgi:hypothetical protein